MFCRAAVVINLLVLCGVEVSRIGSGRFALHMQNCISHLTFDFAQMLMNLESKGIEVSKYTISCLFLHSFMYWFTFIFCFS